MNRTAIFATALLSFAPAFAQSPTSAETFVAARQAEVNGLAESLYFTQLSSRRWVRQLVPQCEAFRHHAFAGFESNAAAGPRFVAVYDLDHAAASSADKPWEGGVTLLRLNSRLDAESSAAALTAAFNRAVAQEKAAHTAAMLPEDEAICLIRIAGEEPAVHTKEDGPHEARPASPVKITSILVPLQATANTRRTASVVFADDGTIASYSVMVQTLPKL